MKRSSRSSYGHMDGGADDGECLGCVCCEQINRFPVVIPPPSLPPHAVLSTACYTRAPSFSTFRSYAETMDDEPDVMNDTALRSVVRLLRCLLMYLRHVTSDDVRDFSSSAHSASQQSRTSITPASSAKVPVLAAPASSKLIAGTS